uniref:Uncharacterized protein n=1 Tax=Arundo donax TaxID=35708 RepID=A0A0A8Z5H7_ARUDO
MHGDELGWSTSVVVK